VKLQGQRDRGQSAHARSSQLDCDASSFWDPNPVRSSLRQMQFIISRLPPSKPIRSRPLKPNAHLSFKATVLETTPQKPARANCISDQPGLWRTGGIEVASFHITRACQSRPTPPAIGRVLPLPNPSPWACTDPV
jgi:hypothetical protein